MEAFFVAPNSLGGWCSWISLASFDEVEQPRFCAHSRPKLPLSGPDLFNLANLGRFPGDFGDSTSSRVGRRCSVSRELEQTSLLSPENASQPGCPPGDRDLGRC